MAPASDSAWHIILYRRNYLYTVDYISILLKCKCRGFQNITPKPSQPEAGALLQPPSSKWLAWLAAKGPGTTLNGPKVLASWNLTDLRWLLRWTIFTNNFTGKCCHPIRDTLQRKWTNNAWEAMCLKSHGVRGWLYHVVVFFQTHKCITLSPPGFYHTCQVTSVRLSLPASAWTQTVGSKRCPSAQNLQSPGSNVGSLVYTYLHTYLLTPPVVQFLKKLYQHRPQIAKTNFCGINVGDSVVSARSSKQNSLLFSLASAWNWWPWI